MSAFVRRLAVLGLAATILVPVATADARKRKPPRPTVKVVKALFTDTWDTEFEHSTGGPGSISLKFERIRIAKLRKNRGESIQLPYGTYYTPVQATFVQTINHTSSEPELSSPFVQPESPSSTYTEVTRVVAEGNFYKSSFGWRYVAKGAKTQRLSQG